MSSRGGRGRGGRDYEGRGRGGRDYEGRGRGGRDYEGRGRGGRDQGPSSGRGRGSGGRAPPTPCPSIASSNVISCTVSPNLTFYVYGIDCKTKSGAPVDSRSRRGQLFNMGVFDPKRGLLARLDLAGSIKEWRRITFFENSVLFSSRPLPGVNLLAEGPVPLVGGGKGSPESDNGDAMTIMDVTVYSPPEELAPKKAPPKAQLEASMATLTMDLRCNDCTKSFVDDKALLQHSKETGHSPVYERSDKETKPANRELFLQYANVVLKRALGERLASWGREYIDPKSFTEPQDSRTGKSLGVRVFKAFTCEFGLHKTSPDPKEKCILGLTVDLRAKVIRTTSLLEVMSNGVHPEQKRYDAREQADFKRIWCNEVVIATYDKRCYSVKDLIFDKSPATLPVQEKGMSHAEYFTKRKSPPIPLKYPNAVPMVEVLGRNEKSIYLPAELVCANELDVQLKSKLPMIASFKPEERHKAIEDIRRFVTPGAQKSKDTKDLLPALGFVLSDSRIRVPVTMLALPVMTSAGMRIPESQGGMWAPLISQANYKVNPRDALNMNVILVYHRSIKNYLDVYKRVKEMTNGFNSTYRLGEKPYQVVEAGDNAQHWGAFEKYFGSSEQPANVFVLDLSRPPRGQSLDPAYSVVKKYLGAGGYLSQFVNFATYDHGNPRDIKKSTIILSGVARQILSKCGVRVWWVNIPKTLPLPAVFVDVFHAPRKFDPKVGKRTAKESVAAVIVTIIRSHESRENSNVEIYCETESRASGQEMKLDTVMNRTVANALKIFKVSPKSCFIWRDGVGDNTIQQVADEEIPAVRRGLSGGVVGAGAAKANVPLSYIVCQKRINTKFLTDDGHKLPCGAMVNALQGPLHKTFYINGTCPPYSTPKPVRFVIAERDAALNNVSPTELSWALCHDYPNWTGPIKLPAPVQLAHKLAELAGGMTDCGRSINHQKYAGKVYFL